MGVAGRAPRLVEERASLRMRADGSLRVVVVADTRTAGRIRRAEDRRAQVPVVGNLGILFVAAALALGLLLSIVALLGYYALSRGEAPARTYRTARLSAPVSGQL